jgi:hypothetical protein
MKWTLAVAAGASLALTTPAGAAAMLFAGSVPRSGIERVQAGPGTGGLRSKDSATRKLCRVSLNAEIVSVRTIMKVSGRTTLPPIRQTRQLACFAMARSI